MYWDDEVLIGVDKQTAMDVRQLLVASDNPALHPLIESLTTQLAPSLVFMYGSLKEGFYNFRRRGSESQIVLEKGVRLEGHALYSLGQFPCAVAEEGSTIVGELHEITPSAFRDICTMEAGAGYVRKRVTVGAVTAFVFVYEGERANRPKESRIEGGEWTLEHQNAGMGAYDLPAPDDRARRQQREDAYDEARKQTKVKFAKKYERIAEIDKEIDTLYREQSKLWTQISSATEKLAEKLLVSETALVTADGE